MKLCKLKLKNLNSFRRPIEIDFENPPLDDASLVAITGPTGSGKTTLLDAICVALYGKTPRLTGSGSQNPHHLISHGEKEAFAEVHFMAGDTRYIAIWQCKQEGSPRVQLRYAEDNKLISDKLSTRGKSVGSSQRTVSEEVESLLGLDFDAFKRSVMLAQGEFAAFLKASNEERRKILEATAGIGIYDILKRTLNEKVDEVEAANAKVLDELKQIPYASHEQLTEAEALLVTLKKEAGTLSTQNQQIQQEKQRETKRKEDFEKLQSSEGRQKELLAQQPEIDALRAEKNDAERAADLRAEKREFDNAKSELEKAEKALCVAATEKTDVEEQVKTDQADFDEKDKAYQDASANHNQKMPIYTNAKVDVGRAVDQFAEASKRTPDLADLGSNIVALDGQLAGKQSQQAQLQGQITNAKNFLDKNPLPSDRQHRLNRATGLLAELDAQQKQLETESQSKTEHNQKVSSLKLEIGRLYKDSQKRLSKKTGAETALKTVTDELNVLLASGTREEWDVRKQQAIQVQPIAQRYEIVEADLVDSEDDLRKLNETKADLNAELEQIEDELGTQAEVCQRAAEAVQDCEAARESTLLADSVNHFRQRLQPGEPCEVCGATEHPRADVVEPDSEDLLQNAENALDNAKSEAQTAEAHRQHLNTRQVQIEQNKRNTTEQIDECTDEIEKLQDERAQLLAKWKDIYPDNGISSGWIADWIAEANTAITDIGNSEQAHTAASFTYQTATQQFENCENDIKREKKSLSDTEEKLRKTSNAVADLQADIASTEERFWDLVPAAFHGVSPQEAKDQFSDKIDEVATRKDELNTAETSLKILDAEIKTDQGSLKTLQDNRDDLQSKINQYRRDGEAYLKTVREKTGGLETEDDINTAIDKLDVELKAKEGERDEAQQQLQDNQTLLTQKQTTLEHCKEQHAESVEKFETARDTYFDGLNNAEFDSPEAHDNAFRDDVRLQEITDRINDYTSEKQQLTIEITRLRTRFEETPFNPAVLGRIESEQKEIDVQYQNARERIGTQRKTIKDLNENLQKREALADELRAAQQELERWQRLQKTIPKNALRDFALEIMFKQMGALANEQLNYLTSERYQLKVETIGDLSVIDRWNANEERPVETLSGGESFLTSLALALALADLSRGRAQLNSLFLDEGFGTLDTETLDIAIAALEGLRMQGRSIFLISHVQELTRRLPVKINVKKHGNDSSESLFSSSVEIRG